MSTLVLYGRAGSSLDSARDPPRIQQSRRRATSAKTTVNGPGIGRAEARYPSSPPRYWRYSGSATSRAPPAAALSASSAAVATFASGSEPASSWTSATLSRVTAQFSVGMCTYADWMPTRPGPVKRLNTRLPLPPNRPVLRPYTVCCIATASSR